MITRSDVERAIEDEEAVVDSVVELLDRKTPLADWPIGVRVAFALALEEPGASAGEQWKAAALRRHLFGDAAIAIASPTAPTAEDRGRAARLRSGLIPRVRLRAGRHLGA